MSDDTVTIRYRDSMLQERVPVCRLSEIISEKVSLKTLLEKIG
jgi:glycyl-tRNA synthetase